MLTIQTFPFNPLGTNCYVVNDDSREAVVIDCGALYPDEHDALAHYIGSNGLRPVEHLLTHAHFDHIFGAAFLHERYGLKPRCHVADFSLLNDAAGQMRTIMGHALRCPVPPAGDAVDANSVIRFGTHTFTVFPTPGHTPGGVCYYCEDERVLFSGDSLFQLSIGRTDLPGGNHWDLIRSLTRLLKVLPADVTIYPGHGPSTTAGTEQQHNPYLAV